MPIHVLDSTQYLSFTLCIPQGASWVKIDTQFSDPGLRISFTWVDIRHLSPLCSVEAWVICFILDVDIQKKDKVIQQKKQDI